MSEQKLSSWWEKWHFYRVIWEGITKKVISEQGSNVARECATCTSGERVLGRGNRWKGPGQDLAWTAPGHQQGHWGWRGGNQETSIRRWRQRGK